MLLPTNDRTKQRKTRDGPLTNSRLPLIKPNAILLTLMDLIGSSTWLWVGFSLFILCMLGLDLGLFNRKAHTIRYREAWIWSGVWVVLAVLFASLVFRHQGSQR